VLDAIKCLMNKSGASSRPMSGRQGFYEKLQTDQHFASPATLDDYIKYSNRQCGHVR